MRPISTILAFQFASLVVGYLFAEGCVTIRNGRHPRPLPMITELATHHAWFLLVATLPWGVYALQAERIFQRTLTREVLPLGLGVAGAIFLFLFFICAGLVALVQPVHLHG